jgi:hypothetical protein
MSIRPFSYTAFLVLLVTACGGGATPEPTAPIEAAPADSAEPAPEPAPAIEEEPASSEPAGPTNRTPKDVVGAEKARFALSFSSSEAGMKAEEKCDGKHKDDPRARNQCMKNARSAIKEDVLQFLDDGTGRWTWITFTQRGSNLIQIKKTNFTWGAETKNSIEIVPSKGSKVVIGVPNNYSVVVEHPTHGKLSYDSKAIE